MMRKDCYTCEFHGGAVCMVDGTPIEKCLKEKKKCEEWGMSFDYWLELMGKDD